MVEKAEESVPLRPEFDSDQIYRVQRFDCVRHHSFDIFHPFRHVKPSFYRHMNIINMVLE
jgi:hypothetical protein